MTEGPQARTRSILPAVLASARFGGSPAISEERNCVGFLL